MYHRLTDKTDLSVLSLSPLSPSLAIDFLPRILPFLLYVFAVAEIGSFCNSKVLDVCLCGGRWALCQADEGTAPHSCQRQDSFGSLSGALKSVCAPHPGAEKPHPSVGNLEGRAPGNGQTGPLASREGPPTWLLPSQGGGPGPSLFPQTVRCRGTTHCPFLHPKWCEGEKGVVRW